MFDAKIDAGCCPCQQEQLIVPRYMMQISANLVFSYTKRELFAS